MKHVQEQLDQPERRVCRVLDQPRSTQRYTPVPRDGDEALIRRLHELVRLHPRRGYRMMCGMLSRRQVAGDLARAVFTVGRSRPRLYASSGA